MKKDINLLPPELAKSRYSAIIVYMVLAFIFIMAFMPLFLRRDLNKELASLNKELGNKLIMEDAYWDLDVRYRDLKMSQKIMKWIDAKGTSLDRLFEIIEGAGYNNIDVKSIFMDNDTITIYGVTEDRNYIPDYLDYLKTIDIILEVNIKEILFNKNDMTNFLYLECNLVTENSDLDNLFDEMDNGDIEKSDFEEAGP